MSTFLALVGRFSARHRLVVIGAWLLIFAALTGTLVVASAHGSPGAASTSIPSTKASQALHTMKKEFPELASSGAPTLQYVFVAPRGEKVTDPEVAANVATVLHRAARVAHVRSVSDPLDASTPYISKDQRLAVATVTFSHLSKAQEKTSYAAALAVKEHAPDGVRVELGGNLVPLGAPAPGIGEGLGVVIAFLVLILTFGSLLAAGSNLLIAVSGVGVGLVGVLAFGALHPIADTSIVLAAMLGLAVGIDYSLFILTRFRSELRAGRRIEDAVARATGTAGTAVVFAGSTVVIALVALIVANISFITEMGVAAAFGIVVAVLMALTLLPAVMRSLGLRALPRKEREILRNGGVIPEAASKTGLFRRWATFIVKRPIIAIVAGAVVLVVVALPIFSMKTAFSIPGGADPKATERTAYNLIVDEFGGVQSPLVVLAEGKEGIASKLDGIEADLGDLPGVRQIVPGQVNADGTIALITIIPKEGPIAQQTTDLVGHIRDDRSVAGVTFQVTGETAIGMDQAASLASALVRYLIVIVVISMLLLIVMFRSLLIPLFATLGYLLSVGASFGASVAVFQWGWLDALIPAPQGDPMMSILPILLVGVLFGLAMDYQVFLVSRIKEMHDRGIAPKEAIVRGFSSSAPVLVAAATIMTVVFAGFASSTFAIAASIAFGLMIGVLADAFIVRLILMPAVLSLLGRAAWWMPAWMCRILPVIDTEGHALDSAEKASPVGSGAVVA